MAFYQEYRFCVDILDPDLLLGDGVCHNFGNYNSAACEFDYGDCDEFNKKYPNCKADYPEYLNNGRCDEGLYNTEECGWDGGDCLTFAGKSFPAECSVSYGDLIGDGSTCHGGDYNTPECNFDDGDCSTFNTKYPKCKVVVPSWVGNGRCGCLLLHRA